MQLYFVTCTLISTLRKLAKLKKDGLVEETSTVKKRIMSGKAAGELREAIYIKISLDGWKNRINAAFLFAIFARGFAGDLF